MVAANEQYSRSPGKPIWLLCYGSLLLKGLGLYSTSGEFKPISPKLGTRFNTCLSILLAPCNGWESYVSLISTDHKEEVTTFFFHGKDQILIALKFNKKFYKKTDLCWSKLPRLRKKGEDLEIAPNSRPRRGIMTTKCKCGPGLSLPMQSTLRIMRKV